MARMTVQELADFLEAQLPPVGQPIEYKAFHAQVKASEQPEALEMYRTLKRQGKVKSAIVQNEDGTITHTIERV